ncbi:MAG: hypothetical protein GW810_03515 [Flavobacteriales bacterium]|nr:hypothetical protein [Flavobacteriales bacterium]
MKTLIVLFAALGIVVSLTSCVESNKKKQEIEVAPLEEKPVVKKDTIKKMNLLDEQAKMLGKVFGDVDTEEGRAFSKVNNYQDLLEQGNFPPDIKKHLYEQYKLYELSLDPKKKDSLKLVFNKKLNEALAKSVSNPK